MSTTAPKLFISYRREETAGYAGRLYDALAARWEERNVFMDVDLAPGVDFVERITEAVGGCHVLLVVIGPKWGTITNDEGQVRIADPEDFVRLEVETALRRPDVTVIPLLVAGARMPDPDDLPADLRSLARRNALEVSDLRWRYDIQRLMSTLDELLAGTTAVRAPSTVLPAPNQSAPRRSRARLILEGMAVGAAAGLIGAWIAELVKLQDATDKFAKVANSVLGRGIGWALVGAALAAWLTVVRGSESRGVARQALTGLTAGALAGVLGGVIFSARVLPPSTFGASVHQLSIGSAAATGALVGALIGSLWTPRRVGAGITAGLVAGALVLVLVFGGGWKVDSAWERVLLGGIQALVLTALVLTALHLVVGHRASRKAPPLESPGGSAGYPG